MSMSLNIYKYLLAILWSTILT